MAKRLALGVLIVFASFGIAVATAAGFDWWQSRGGDARHIEVAPAGVDTRRGAEQVVPNTPDPTVTTTVRAEPHEAVHAEPKQSEERTRRLLAETETGDAKAAAAEAAAMAQAEAAAREAAAAEAALAAAMAEAESAVVTRAVEAALLIAQAEAELDQVLARPESDLRDSEVAIMETALEAARAALNAQLIEDAASVPLHPQVQAQGMERVLAVVEGRGDAWPWVVQALDVARFSFFEDLPSECAGAIGCYHHATGYVWITLDALREPDPLSFSSLMGGGRDPGHIVLHELAHAYTRSFPPTELIDLYERHYAGCRSRSLDTTQLVVELLADTMAMSAMSDGDELPRDYGYFRSGGFERCLAESSRPDTTLVRAVYAALFNCDSEHALDVYADHLDPLHDLGRVSLGHDVSGGDAVLLTCYGIDCITPDRGCETMTEADERRDTAADRLHERRCSDGVIVHGRIEWGARTEPGWEHGCDAHIPDDVECLVDVHGNEPEQHLGRYHGEVHPGLLDVSGECIVPVCVVDGPGGEPQPGHKGYWGVGECVPIDRPASGSSDTNG